MYRAYEDPFKLEDMLAELKEEYANETEEEARISLACSIADLQDRIRFAWDDDENG